MCEGEFESMKAIHAVTPDFVPKPYAWGKYRQDDPEIYFLLAEFREVGKQVRAVISQAARKHVTHSSTFYAQRIPTSLAIQNQSCFPFATSLLCVASLKPEQPADPVKLAAGLAEMHQKSVSPSGKFGFHMGTCHAKIVQAVGSWEDSWCALYTRHLGHVVELARPILNWPEFDLVCKLTLQKVVPRLLLPLEAEGRILKPCLIHGDVWDGK